MGHTGIIHDALAFLPKSSAELISKGHNFAYRYAPKLYGVGYRFEEKHPPTIFYEQSAKGADELLRTLRTDGADAAICVHVFPAMMVTELRRRGQLSIPAYFVATDYTCSPGVGELDMDGFCIPHEALMDEFTSCGVKRSLLYATGIPVSPEFSQPMDRKALRHTLHLEDKRRILVLACGSMGAGPMRSAAAKLAQNLSTDDKLIMVCGSNRRLYRYSKLALAEYPQVQVVGFTKRMPQYLHVCDVLITKAGGLTTMTEKNLGSFKTQGHGRILGILDCGDPVPGPGNWGINQAQGANDAYASTTLAMSGCHICLFTTGRGNPIGNACMTTIKITGNPTTATMLEDMIDYSAKPMLYGEKTLQESGRELYDLILRVANGEETKAEKLGDYSWTTPHGTSYNGDY